VYNDRRVAAGDYLPGWRWKINDEVGTGVGQLHGRVAHLDIVRAPESGFNWKPCEGEAPSVLQGFRDFMVRLREHDEGRYELLLVPDVGLPFVDVIPAIDEVLPRNWQA